MTLLEELHIRSLKVWNTVKITFERERTYCSFVCCIRCGACPWPPCFLILCLV